MPAPITTESALLKERLLVMASYAEAAVNRAVKALVRRDDDLARRTREDDDLIDSLEVEIDSIAHRLLAGRPGPLELRFITTAMKIAANLERVGDEATTISRRVLELSQEPQLQQAAEVPPMAATALEMLKDALDSFVHRDPVKARQVIPRDKGLDQQNKRLHRDLTALMSEKSIYITRALNLMVISKSLERIGDHAANVAEQVVYLCEGLDIRHDAGTGRSEPGPSPRSPGVPRPD